MKIYKPLILLGVVALLVISGCTDKSTGNFSGEMTQRHNPETQSAMNMSLNAIMVTKEGINYQEAGLQIKADGYSPEVIIAKKGVPLKINVTSDSDAGCATEIVFPEFNITRIVPAGKTDIIEIMPLQEGTFNYRCSMDMYRGKLMVTK